MADTGSKSIEALLQADDSRDATVLVDKASIPWGLVSVLSILFLIFWQLPPLEFLKRSELVFTLLEHTVTESFAIVVSVLVFAVSWNAYSRERPGNIQILACGFLAVGLLDFAHMLSYKGMPDFITPAEPQKAIVFWLSARYVASITLLAVALKGWAPFENCTTRYRYLGLSLVVTAVIYALQLLSPESWPRMFVSGDGLTATKIALEYGIVVILAPAAWLFYRHAQRQRTFDAANLFTAALITILSELCFTLYSNVNDIFSLMGHIYKVIAYYFIYKAIFVSSVQEPYRRLTREMAERKQAEARIEFLAYHDSLTDLPNRLLVRQRFADAAAQAKAAGQRVALMFIDLDNFKNINDSLGHAVGDQMLKAVAARIGELIHPGNTLSRQGGDEFLLVVGELADGQALMPMLDSLMDQLQEPMPIGEEQLSISVSIGTAFYPDDGEDFDTLLKKADTAMYRAKAAGRNTYRFFDVSMLKDAADRLRIRNGLRLALERQEFRLHYQPQVDLASGRIIGFEALIRWQHPELGMVPPFRFITVAEECGLIVPIGEWVMQEACRQMVAWQAAGLGPLVVAVNLSAVQFFRGDLEKTVSDALQRSGLPPACLELELTESILIQDTDTMLGMVERLDALGVQMSIDDFGTGYSSLSYLKRFAVDKLKIDQSFVRALADAPEDDAIVRAIIQMADSLGLRTIAEGVETGEVSRLLARLGCHEVQGYFYAKPLAAEDVPAFVLSFTAQA